MGIAVGVPYEANIPYFAMSVEPRDSRATVVSDATTITKTIGKHTYQWLSANAEYRNAWRLITTRTFVPPKTALYCHWLFFLNEALEQRFLEQFPRMSRVAQVQALSEKLSELRTSLEKGLAAGGYDLSKSAPQSRGDVARSFLRKHEEIESLKTELDQLLRQEQEMVRWSHLGLSDFV